MNYEDCLKHTLKVEWKVSTCEAGEKCWCRIIELKKEMRSNDMENVYISGPGTIPKIVAEHIVKMHNESLKNKS